MRERRKDSLLGGCLGKGGRGSRELSGKHQQRALELTNTDSVVGYSKNPSTFYFDENDIHVVL